ncbi:MBL fold metallo-hydrolase [Methanobrevibacter millerae]|uniref:Metallo-beta-lactamase superfamily protein n=1 Tax=Methanobrevibacter millerae TaxID=230361 RepID=A0A1G5X6L5_9EURY|nr:MBL fold metallo-hydrolase [Methanobrevibacter millerae]SDA66059.1 Metallo-beta-lactamase superfamily protein [Methanobrevibacter millerae]
MNKTFITKMPNHIGAFLKASKCLSDFGINITRVSYNKSVDSHLLFIDVEGSPESLEKATQELMSIGYIHHNLDHRDVVLLEFKLKDIPGAVTPILELISDFNFNITYISSQQTDKEFQFFKMGLVVENQANVNTFIKKASEICPIKVINSNYANKIYDNSFFYNNFVNQISSTMDISYESKNELIINTNLVMQMLNESGVLPFHTFDSISRFTEIIAASKGENFTPRITNHKITKNSEITLIEPPCGSNITIIKSYGKYLFIDTGYACYEEEMHSIIKEIIPDFDNIPKEVFITHADVDHCGLLPLFDIIYASSKSAESLKSEYNNESNFREKNPLHKPYIRICNILTSYKPVPPQKIQVVGDERTITKPLEQTGVFDFGEFHFSLYEGKGGHLPGESVLIDFEHKIAFTGDIFINMKDMIPKQAEYNRYAPILMTSVDFDSDLCREERNNLFNKLNTGKWQIFGGHGGKRTYESN